MSGLQNFSRTAFMSGATRATHVMWDAGPAVLNDVFTALVLPSEFAEFVKDRLQREDSDLNPAGRASVVWRARTTEDALDRAMAAGVRQYAVLGAGMDSFGWRRNDLLPELQVYEIDHPLTQEWKRACMARAGIPVPAGLNHVPVDFAAMRLREGLDAAHMLDLDGAVGGGGDAQVAIFVGRAQALAVEGRSFEAVEREFGARLIELERAGVAGFGHGRNAGLGCRMRQPGAWRLSQIGLSRC